MLETPKVTQLFKQYTWDLILGLNTRLYQAGLGMLSLTVPSQIMERPQHGRQSRGSSYSWRPYQIVMNGQHTLGVFLLNRHPKPPGAVMYELRVMYAQAEGMPIRGAGLPEKGKALM